MVTKRGYTTGEALTYLGIKRRAFERHIQPLLRCKGIRIGTCIVFDVSDLDAAWEAYKMDIGSERPALKGELPWDAPRRLAFTGHRPAITLTSNTGIQEYTPSTMRFRRF
jgi:hypothetical protein